MICLKFQGLILKIDVNLSDAFDQIQLLYAHGVHDLVHVHKGV